MKGFNKENTTIFSIDMNNGFAKKGALYSNRVENLIEPTAAFLAKAKKAGIRIVGFTDAHNAESIEFGAYPVHCLDGTDEAEIVPELKDFMDQIIKKNSTNPFFAYTGTFEADHQYIITGCCTDICIYQFAVTLRAYLNQHNIHGRIIVPRDLVDTFDAPGHDGDLLQNIFLQSMAANGIEIPSSIL